MYRNPLLVGQGMLTHISGMMFALSNTSFAIQILHASQRNVAQQYLRTI